MTVLLPTDNTIQETLIDLLGYESLDFTSELLLNRSTIVENIMAQVRCPPVHVALLQYVLISGLI